MKNIEMSVKAGKLTLVIDLNKECGKSGSLKNIIVATTGGNVDVEGAAPGTKLGLNLYKPVPAGA